MSARERSPPGAWMGTERAAAFLGMPAVTLRRQLERSARRGEDGAIVARLDGITARKLGRSWRVWLGAGWVSPQGSR